MKILLIYPYFLEARLHVEDISTPPMGIYYVAAVLKEHHYDVEILNWHNIDKTPEKIEEVLTQTSPDVIGFSVLNANRWGGIEIARTAKHLDPDVKIVIGGIGATFLWEHLLRHFREIDYIVLGEGEYTFLNVIQSIENEDNEGLKNIKGIAFRENGKIQRTEDAELIPDLDELPIPAQYFQYQTLSSTRGCAWKCTFCGSPQFWGQKIRFRSPEKFVEELEILYNKGITFFYVADDNFTINKDRVVEICKRILEKDLKISWNAISRVDHVDDDLLFWMRKAGCIQISYGVESGSEKIRHLLNKKITTDQIKKAFQTTTRYGILARAYFIYGCPGETWETIQDTISLMHEIKPLSIIFYILDIFPGTELFADLKTRAGLDDDIWLKPIEGIMFADTDPRLSDELILAFGQKLRTEFYDNIRTFVDSIHLIDKKELYEMHSDFYSRLGMTFSHGDYSKIGAIKGKDEIAEKLFRNSLSYHPNHRAFLGLGIIKQKKREYEEAIKILSKGIESFPESEDLNICQGINYMNLNDHKTALSYFLRFPNSEESMHQAARCYEELSGRAHESI